MKEKVIIIEGPDGVGKTTLAKKIVLELRDIFPDHKVSYLREPGGLEPGDRAEKIREEIMSRPLANTYHEQKEEAHLLEKCRRYMIEDYQEKYKDVEKRIIVLDRSVVSSLVYQNKNGLTKEEIIDINKDTIEMIGEVNLMIFLTVPTTKVEDIVKRMNNADRTNNKYDPDNVESHKDLVSKYNEVLSTVFNFLDLDTVEILNALNTLDENVKYSIEAFLNVAGEGDKND